MSSTTVANVPASVTVAFPRSDYGIVASTIHFNSVRVDNHYAVLITGSGHTGTHLIHSTAVANFTTDVTPTNASQLNTLAAKIAADWYAWRLSSLEIRYESVVGWISDGMHDVEWIHGPVISTAVHRSAWEPDHGELKHAGEFGSSDLQWPLTEICLTQANGSDVRLTLPKAWVAFSPPCDGGGGGTGPGCPQCLEDPSNQLCVVFPGLTDDTCTQCDTLTEPVTLVLQPPLSEGDGHSIFNLDCWWQYEAIAIQCSGNEGAKTLIGFGWLSHLDVWNLDIYMGESGSFEIMASYLSDPSPSWDCNSPLELALDYVGYGPFSAACGNWPASITVQPCGVGIPPTMIFDSSPLCNGVTTMTILGTGFVTPASDNTLTFSSGSGTATSVTGSTSMSVSFSVAPSNGALTCTVTNANGTSMPVQVALVLTCGTTLWQDTFTDTNGTNLTAHTGETTPSAYVNFDGAMQIQSNKAVNVSADDDFGFIFDAGATAYTFTCKFLIPPVSQDAGVRTFRAYARFLDADNCYFAEVIFSASATTCPAFNVYKRQVGIDTLVDTGSISLNEDTEYECQIVATYSQILFTIDGTTSGDTSTTFNVYSKVAIHFHSVFWSTSKPYCDTLLMVN